MQPPRHRLLISIVHFSRLSCRGWKVCHLHIYRLKGAITRKYQSSVPITSSVSVNKRPHWRAYSHSGWVVPPRPAQLVSGEPKRNGAAPANNARDVVSQWAPKSDASGNISVRPETHFDCFCFSEKWCESIRYKPLYVFFSVFESNVIRATIYSLD